MRFSPKQTSSTAHTLALLELQVYGSCAPGGEGSGLPLFFDKYKEAPEDPDYLAWGASTDVIPFFDPHHRTCVFGTNGAGEIVTVRFDHYRNCYVTLGEQGLTRRATIDIAADLSTDGVTPAEATIEAKNGAGDAIGSLVIDLYYHGPADDDIPGGSNVVVHYQSMERKWYTGAFYRDP